MSKRQTPKWNAFMTKWIIILISVFCANSAMAQQFVSGKAEWDRYTENQKASYLMGVYDSIIMLNTADTKDETAVKIGRDSCVKSLKITNYDLARLVNDAYARDVAIYSYPPSIVLQNQLWPVCRLYIERARADAGLH
jgi:hypothetical protein